MPYEPGNQEGKKADHRKPRIITQKLIARLNDAEGKALDRLISALIAEAHDGDVAAIREIFDRVEGKVPQGVTGGEGGPLTVIHRIERVIKDAANPDS